MTIRLPDDPNPNAYASLSEVNAWLGDRGMTNVVEPSVVVASDALFRVIGSYEVADGTPRQHVLSALAWQAWGHENEALPQHDNLARISGTEGVSFRDGEEVSPGYWDNLHPETARSLSAYMSTVTQRKVLR